MPSEFFDPADTFAATASKLLSEYTNRLNAKRQEIEKIIDKFYNDDGKREWLPRPAHHLQRQYRSELRDFMDSKETYQKLIRKTSQWLEHGNSPQPHLELELEVRLADFENTLQSLERFLVENKF